MNDLPYATWSQGPSPKQVYAAYGDTFVGYVPVGWRIREKINADTEALTALEFKLTGIDAWHYIAETGRTLEENPGIMVCVKSIPLWQARFMGVLQQYPRHRHTSSFYLFENFVVNDDRDVLLWTKYTMRAAWTQLTTLDLLKPRDG